MKMAVSTQPSTGSWTCYVRVSFESLLAVPGATMAVRSAPGLSSKEMRSPISKFAWCATSGCIEMCA